MTEKAKNRSRDRTTSVRAVSELLSRYKKAFDEKEACFLKKEVLKSKIREHIGSLKQIKSERDSFNTSIKRAKVQRKEAHASLQHDRSALQHLKQEQAGITQRVKGSPAALRRRIEQLEQKVETEAMSFDKEKALMNEIRKLRKEAHVADSAQELFGHTREAAREMYTSRRKADKIHKSIQTTAKQSQKRHVQLKAALTELRTLEKEQEAAFNAFITGKRICQELQKQIARAKTAERKVEHGKQAQKLQRDRRKQIREQAILKEKARSVEAKIKKQGRLTTEDLLVLQGLKK